MDDRGKISMARHYGLANAPLILIAARRAKLPFYAACALMEKESHGRNVYGRDAGGTFSGAPFKVNRANWVVFRWLVFSRGHRSNGVGPAQLTYPGFFTDMERKGLKPWNAEDNMFYGFQILRGYKDEYGTWERAGEAYNGSSAYGKDFAAVVEKWRRRIND